MAETGGKIEHGTPSHVQTLGDQVSQILPSIRAPLTRSSSKLSDVLSRHSLRGSTSDQELNSLDSGTTTPRARTSPERIEPFSLYEIPSLTLNQETEVDIIAVHDYAENLFFAWTGQGSPTLETIANDPILPRLIPPGSEAEPTSKESSAVTTEPEGLSQDDRQSQTSPQLTEKELSQVKSLGREHKELKLKERCENWRDVVRNDSFNESLFEAVGDPHRVHWLSDPNLLRREIPRARILLFEYCEPAREEKTPPKMKDLVNALYDRLKVARSSAGERPLVFVCHGFGVTIVEEFLMKDWEESNISMGRGVFCMSTAAILFLSKGLEDKSYLRLRDERCGPGIAKLPYSDFNETILSSHLDRFAEFIASIRENRFAVDLHCVPSDGVISEKTNRVYLAMLQSMMDSVNIYKVLMAVMRRELRQTETLLLVAADPNLQNSAGQSALHLAVRTKNIQMVQLLLSANADANSTDREGTTPLHSAVRTYGGDDSIICMLLKRGANVNAKDTAGKTSLDIARDRGYSIDILTHPPRVDGAVEDSENVPATKSRPPESADALDACANFNAYLTEFYLVGKKEEFETETYTIMDLLYRNTGDIAIQQADRTTKDEERLSFRWLHLPANNISWVNRLFERLGLTKDAISYDQHEGSTPWSRYLRPQARYYRAMERWDPDGNWHIESHSGKNFALFFPFLQYERWCDFNEIYSTTTARPVSAEPDNDDVTSDTTPKPLVSPNFDNVKSSGEARGNLEGDVRQRAAATGAPEIPRIEMLPDQGQYGSRLALDGSDPLKAEKSLIQGYLWHEKKKGYMSSDLHFRRSLDQSHYFMLKDTTSRDCDQVVLRNFQKSKMLERRSLFWAWKDLPIERDSEAVPKDPKKWPPKKREHPIVMVDQLWLWVIGDTIISSFPQSWLRPDKQRQGDIFERIQRYLNSKRRAQIKSAINMANIIISHCVNVFNQPESSLGLALHCHFEERVGELADKESQLFRQFEEASTVQLSEDIDQKTREDRLDSLLNIREEIKLLDEIKDVRDEITMILKVLNDQAMAVADLASMLRESSGASAAPSRQSPASTRQFTQDFVESPSQTHKVVTTFNEATPNAPVRSEITAIPFKDRHPIIDGNVKDFDTMLGHTTATYEALKDLLGLKQKQANASEAWTARKDAEEVASQGTTIMFFTLVTIVFGSSSLVEAFLALNVTAFPKDKNGSTSWNLIHLIPIIIGISMLICLPFFLVAFVVIPLLGLAGWDEQRDAMKRKMYAWFKKCGLWGDQGGQQVQSHAHKQWLRRLKESFLLRKKRKTSQPQQNGKGASPEMSDLDKLSQNVARSFDTRSH